MDRHEDGLRQLGSWLAWQDAAGVVDLVEDITDRVERLDAGAAAAARSLPVDHPAGGTSMSLFADRPNPEVGKASRRIETGDVANARRCAQACNDLVELEAALSGFDGCALKKTATRLCFADGNPAGGLVLVGEAPGAEEDRQGKPFVGVSGRLLDRMMVSIGFTREDFWITNCLFWRPPGNRTPSAQEVLICQPFLERALQLVRPAMVLFVGGTAARSLLGLDEGVTRLRGKFRTWRPDWSEHPIETLVTFHPAYLLRNPAQKKLVWRDLLQLKQRFENTGRKRIRPPSPHEA